MLASVAKDDVIIEHPNRDKPGSQTTRALVVGAAARQRRAFSRSRPSEAGRRSGGPSRCRSPTSSSTSLLAFYVARWRGVCCPSPRLLDVILLIFCAVGDRGDGRRDRVGFEDPLLAASVVGVLTIVLIPLQILLIVVAARGFSQRWSVEVERRLDGLQPYVAQSR